MRTMAVSSMTDCASCPVSVRRRRPVWSQARRRLSRLLFFCVWSCIRPRMSASMLIASLMKGPLLSMTHSARWAMAASVTSARDGLPVRARVSSTWVAQITGTWAASQSHRISSWTSARRSNPASTARSPRAIMTPTSAHFISSRRISGKRLESRHGLNLEQDVQVPVPLRIEVGQEFPHVCCAADKGHAHDVGQFPDVLQIGDVLLGQGRDGEPRVRQVDALFCAEPRTLRRGGGDPGRELARPDGGDHAADLAVVEPDPFPGPHVSEDAGECAPDAVGAHRGAVRGLEAAAQDNAVTAVDKQALPHSREVPDFAGGAARIVAFLSGGRDRDRGEFGAGREIDGFVQRHEAPVGGCLLDDEGAAGSARVVQPDLLAPPAGAGPGIVIQGNRRQCRAGRWVGCLFWCFAEPHASRFQDRARVAAERFDPEDAGTGADRAGPQLGAGEIHGDEAALPGGLLCGADVVDHVPPCLGSVVGAVDAGQVHPPLHHAADQGRVRCRLARQRDHDARGAVFRSGPQEVDCIPGEQLAAVRETGGRRGVLAIRGDQPGEGPDQRFDAGQHMGFRASERGQAVLREPGLGGRGCHGGAARRSERG